MCELLALSTSQSTRLTFSLHTLASRGGETGTTRDGRGVAFYQGADVSLFREPAAAGNSPLVRHLETEGPSTNLAISHIRHATQGSVQLSNTQPFVRELGGRTHVFAHNGDLTGIDRVHVLSMGPYRPVGQTDSERAFCALLERFRPLWAEAVHRPCQSTCRCWRLSQPTCDCWARRTFSTPTAMRCSRTAIGAFSPPETASSRPGCGRCSGTAHPLTQRPSIRAGYRSAMESGPSCASPAFRSTMNPGGR